MRIDIIEAAKQLSGAQDILILTHQKPDGDTLGSASALMYALRSLKKRAAIRNPDQIPARYDYLYDEAAFSEFEPQFIVAVDVADTQLLGEALSQYIDRIDLCVDHHPSNKNYAKSLLLDESAAATAEIIYEIILTLGVKIDLKIANALFTGITTDTGCFRYSNVTARTHYIASRMIDTGAQHIMINRLMFETKTKSRLAVECEALETLEYHFDNRCALVCLTLDILERTGADEDDLEGVSAIPRAIEGVDAGITIREKKDSAFRISVRTSDALDASRICQKFGGGGHARAAGCTLSGTIGEVKAQILSEIGVALSVGEFR